MALTASQQKELLQSPLFRGCSKDDYLPLFDTMEPLILSKGQVLTTLSSHRPVLYILLNGELECSTNTGVVFGTYSEPFVFSTSPLFQEHSSGQYFPQISVHSSAATLTSLTHESLIPLLSSDSTLALNFIRFQSETIRGLIDVCFRFSASSPSVRLAMYLLQEAKNDELHVVSGISNLARSLDVSRATLYRSLSELEQQNLIQHTGKTILLLDREALIGYIDSSSDTLS
ncbi:MAG: Crp/Fnr family transcriptional regulator [Butyricicoccus sp.]